VEGHYEKLAPDPSRASEYMKFILDGRLDVDEANAHWVCSVIQEVVIQEGIDMPNPMLDTSVMMLSEE
jgi:hypothetical protein